MNTRIYIVLSIVLTFVAVSCVYRNKSDIISLNDNSTCENTGVTYTITAQILDLNCNDCHDASSQQGGIILDNYTDVNAIVDQGLLSCVINHNAGCLKMPQFRAKLSDCAISKIENWISNGAKND
jgi:hypothetical protein